MIRVKKSVEELNENETNVSFIANFFECLTILRKQLFQFLTFEKQAIK